MIRFHNIIFKKEISNPATVSSIKAGKLMAREILKVALAEECNWITTFQAESSIKSKLHYTFFALSFGKLLSVSLSFQCNWLTFYVSLHLSLIFKLAMPSLLSAYLGSFQTNIKFLQQYNVKNVHPVSRAGNQTTDLLNVSVLP